MRWIQPQTDSSETLELTWFETFLLDSNTVMFWTFYRGYLFDVVLLRKLSILIKGQKVLTLPMVVFGPSEFIMSMPLRFRYIGNSVLGHLETKRGIFLLFK